MRGVTGKSVARAGGALALLVTAGALASSCGRGDEQDALVRDVTESGAAPDVIGRPEGADSIPPQMTDRTPEPPLPPESLPPAPARDTSAGADTAKRPERRPIRDIPPLTRPDSGRP